MTDKNFVHGSVQRSEQESNPITCDLVSHTPKLVSYTGCVWDRNRHLPTGRYVKNKPETKASSTDLSRTLCFSSVVHVVSATYSASTVVRETNS